MKRGSGACDGRRAKANRVARSVSSIKQLDVRSAPPGSQSTDIMLPGNIGRPHYRRSAQKIFSSCANENLFFRDPSDVTAHAEQQTELVLIDESCESDKGSTLAAITRRAMECITPYGRCATHCSPRTGIFARPQPNVGTLFAAALFAEIAHPLGKGRDLGVDRLHVLRLVRPGVAAGDHLALTAERGQIAAIGCTPCRIGTERGLFDAGPRLAQRLVGREMILAAACDGGIGGPCRRQQEDRYGER